MDSPKRISEKQKRNTSATAKGAGAGKTLGSSFDEALLVMSSSGAGPASDRSSSDRSSSDRSSSGRDSPAGPLPSLPAEVEDAPAVCTDALQQQASDLGTDALDAPIVKQLVSRFLASSREAVPAVVEAVEEGKWGDAAEAAHQIKGGAGHVGAEALAEAGRAIEQGIEEERFGRVRRVAKELPEALSDAESELRETVGPLPK